MNHEIYEGISVEIVAPYTLNIEFDDATDQRINFLPVLKGELLEPLLDETLFNQVRLDDEVHTIVWPNGADFDPATLHDWNIYEIEIVSRAQQWAKVAEKHDEYT